MRQNVNESAVEVHECTECLHRFTTVRSSECELCGQPMRNLGVCTVG